MDKEYRVSDVSVEKRDDGIGAITGYAAVFNKDSEDMGFIERIAPGAFKKAIKNSDVRALKNHDPNWIIGRSGVNLELKEDKQGLFMRVTRPNPMTETWRSVAQDIEAGLITQQSFGFTVAKEEWDDKFQRRTILEVDRLYDVSPVTYPAYPDTSVAMRSREKAMEFSDDSTVKVADGEKVFEFKNFEQFDRIAEKINEMRATDIANNDQTLEEPPESVEEPEPVANNMAQVDADKRFQELEKSLIEGGF